MKFDHELEIIDAHFHQWDPANTPHALRGLNKLFAWNAPLYQWVAERLIPNALVDDLGTVKYMINPYLPADFQQDVKGHNVKAAVFTPYSWQVKTDVDLAGETQFVEDLYGMKSSSTSHSSAVELGAIVGNAHLENTKDLQALLDNHQRASHRFRGIRDMIDWCDDPGVLSHAHEKNMSSNPQWLKGFEVLAKNDLFFDAFVYHHQLPEMDTLAKRFPDTQMILSHMGIPIGAMGPFASYGHSGVDRDRIIKQWQSGMALLAQNKNVVVKLSGLFMPVLGWGLHNGQANLDNEDIVDRLQPLIDFTIEQFGVERCMFGSHFAPDKASLSYTRLYDLYKRMTQHRSLAEKELLFSKNAKRVYQIAI